MLRATLYIMACTAKNRVRRRVARLREPRYLLGAIVGFSYLYFAFFTRMRATRVTSSSRIGRSPTSFLPAFGAAGPALAGLLLLAGASLSWAMPFRSGLLEFTKAETEFLFPAPVTRRQLVVYRLLRSQGAVFLGALVVAVTYPTASIPVRIRGLVSMWVILMTCHVFFTGVTLARPQLDRWKKGGHPEAWAALGLTVAALSVVLLAVVRAIWRQPVDTAEEALHLLGGVSQNGLPHAVLFPLVALVRPLFAESVGSFLRALPLALAVYALAIAWLLRADAAFGTGVDDAAGPDTLGPVMRTVYRARPIGWTLGLVGRLEPVFIWKSALQTFRIVDRRVIVRFVVILVWMTLAVALIGRARGIAQGIGFFAAFGAVFVVFMGPQILQLDLRQDLQHLELLKTWPARPSAVVRGEILWPAAMITAIAWVFTMMGLLLSAAAFSRAGLAWRMAAGGAGMILTPALVLAQYTVHNATALTFPAWIATGRGRPRGVDAMGQRLIVLGGTWIVLILALAPGAIVGALLWSAFYGLIGPWVLLPAAVACSAIVMLEVLLATEAMGRAYERLDVTSVEPGD